MELTAYRQFAELEEEHFWFRGRRRIFFSLLDQWFAHNKQHLGDREPEILEIGCGAGGLLRRLGRYGNAKGLELSHELSVLANERSRRPTICGNAYEIPLKDETQDLVCLFDTLEHIPDEARALVEIRRVLRPGGLAFFSVPAYQFLYSHNDRVAHHERRYTKRRLRSVVEDAGLTTVRLTYFNLLLFPVILPIVLAGKAKEKLFGVKDPGHTNLSFRIPKPINGCLAWIMERESKLLPRVGFPCGHSLIGMFQRP